MANKLQYQVAVVTDQNSITTVDFDVNSDESSILDCGGTAPARIYFPSDWTACNVSFLISETPTGTFSPLNDFEGDDFAIQARANQWVPLVPGQLHSVLYLKIKCSTPQLNACSANLTLVPYHQGIHN